MINAEDLREETFLSFDRIILGVPTWFDGELPNYWDEFVPALEDLDLHGKKIALFGLGDQDTYPDSFADGVGMLYAKIKDKSSIVGKWPKNGYHFHESEALRNDAFVGLIIDQENQSAKTRERLEKWVEMLKKEFV